MLMSYVTSINVFAGMEKLVGRDIFEFYRSNIKCRFQTSSSDIVRCIHIGLLCVQENVASRPTMASVVIMLTSNSLSLPLPSKPAFYIHTTDLHFTPFSTNNFSITQLDPR